MAPSRSTDDAIAASKVAPKKVEWLWRERIPKRAITVVAGKPDQGKGLFAAYVAGEVSRAGGNVLYSAFEDDHGMMTRPRLEAAGAELDKVFLWRFQLPTQFNELVNHVIDNDVKLVVMDPFAAHLRGINRYSDKIRDVLTPVTKLCETTGCSVLIIEHALKKVARDAHPLNAIGGSSSGLPAVARAGYVMGIDPGDSDRRVLCCVKLNLKEKPKALAFETDVDDFPIVGEVPSLMIQGETEFDPIRLLQTSGFDSKPGRRPDKRAAAAEWLTMHLASAGQPLRAGDVIEDAKQFGLASKTVRRAAEDMEVVKRPPGGGRNCTWDLNDAVKKALGLKIKKTPASKDVKATTKVTQTKKEAKADG